MKAITTRSGVAMMDLRFHLLLLPPHEGSVKRAKRGDKGQVAPKPKPKPSIPYPSRLNDKKLREKANNQMLKFLQIVQRLHFDISFTDALLHMPKFASTFKSLLSNKEKLFELAKNPLNEIFSAVLLKKLIENLDDLGSYETLNQVNVIDVACEEFFYYLKNVLDFRIVVSGESHSFRILSLASSSPLFTPFKGGYFILEEIETFLRTPEEISNLDDDYYDTEGDILYLEKLLNEDPFILRTPLTSVGE
ncbi:hypothetical protein Tco_0326965 [Tanacetum coccineum]